MLTNKNSIKPQPLQQNNYINNNLVRLEPLKPSLFKAEEFDHKSELLCLFCGGKTCSHEDYNTNPLKPNAVEGLHSNWITNDIVASQRLSERLIAQHNLYDRLKHSGIRTILNVQEPGEHPYCGDGIVGNCGFTYDPEKLFANNIQFFNYSWEDMETTTNELMMKIMNVFALTFRSNDKILVHCHAGKGRTLMAICSWLIYGQGYSAEESIQLALKKRGSVLTRSSQRDFLRNFQKFVRHYRLSFGSTEKMSLHTLIIKQQQVMLQSMKSRCENTSYVHREIISELRRRLESKETTAEQIIRAVSFDEEEFSAWSEGSEKNLAQLKKELNQLNIKSLPLQTDLRALTEVLHDFYEQLYFLPINSTQIESMITHKQSNMLISNILTEPEVIHLLGIPLISTLISFAEFICELTQLSDKIYEKMLSTRIAKILATKKKFQKGQYKGRKLLVNCQISNRQQFLVDLLMDLAGLASPERLGLIRKTKQISADMHYHLKAHKKSINGSRLYTQQEMQEVYVKCLR